MHGKGAEIAAIVHNVFGVPGPATGRNDKGECSVSETVCHLSRLGIYRNVWQLGRPEGCRALHIS